MSTVARVGRAQRGGDAQSTFPSQRALHPNNLAGPISRASANSSHYLHLKQEKMKTQGLNQISQRWRSHLVKQVPAIGKDLSSTPRSSQTIKQTNFSKFLHLFPIVITHCHRRGGLKQHEV